MKKKGSKQWYIGLSAVLLLTLMVCFILFTNSYIRKFDRTLMEENKTRLSEISDHIVTYTQSVVADTQNALMTASSAVAVMGEEQRASYLKNMASSYGFAYVGYAWGDGMFSSSEETQNVDISEESYFKEAMGGNYAATGLVRKILTDRAVSGIIMAVPLYGEDGGVNGVLAGLLEVSRLNKALDIESFAGEGYSYIIDREGNLILRNKSMDYNNFFKVLDNVEIDGNQSVGEVEKAIVSGECGVISYKQFGVEQYAYYSPVGFDSWTLLNIVSKDTITRKTAELTRELVSISVIMILVFILLLTVAGGSWISSQNQKHRSELKSAFLANVSHEIRTPMNVIVGISEMLLRSSLDEKQRKYVRSIQSSSKGLISIINDILDMSKIESGKLNIVEESYNIRELLEEITLMAEIRIDKKPVEFITEIAPDIPEWLIGDKTRVRQILMNLVGNSVKFTDEGHVRLSVEALEKEEKLELRVRVEDTGIGIKKQDMKKLFVSFSQVDTYKNHKKEGTGLGLAISKSLSQMMGGNIQVESEYGKGSVFTVTLLQAPAQGKEAEVVVQEDYSKPQTFRTYTGARILLVDDNELNLEIAQALLEPYGMSIDCVLSGPEAIQAVQTHEYHLVFMDHMMPDMDGVETLKVIRKLPDKKFKRLPVVALTANATMEARAMFMREGFDGFLAKPIEMNQVRDILETYVKDCPKE